MSKTPMSTFETVTFSPEETVTFTINGQRVELKAGLEATVPQPFFAAYERKRALAPNDTDVELMKHG